MDTGPVIEQTVFANAEQAARDKALRRFNWLFVYMPVALLGLGMLALLVWLAWVSLPDAAEKRQAAVSGVADIILILWLCPTVLLCALGPGLGIFLLVRRRQSGSVVRQRLQRLLWRLENLIATVRPKLLALEARLAQPVIAGHGWLSFVRAWLSTVWRSVKALFRRS